MELMKGICTVCGVSGRVINYKNCKDVVEMVLEIFPNEINKNNFENFKCNVKLCPICLYKLQNVHSKKDNLMAISSPSKEHKNICFICKTNKLVLIIENSYALFSKNIESYKILDKQKNSLICAECFYILNNAFYIKRQLLDKYPNLKRGILRKNSIRAANENDNTSKLDLISKGPIKTTIKINNRNKKRRYSIHKDTEENNRTVIVMKKNDLIKKLLKSTLDTYNKFKDEINDKKFSHVAYVCLNRVSYSEENDGSETHLNLNNSKSNKKKLNPFKIKLKTSKTKTVKTKQNEVKKSSFIEDKNNKPDVMQKDIPVKNVKVKLERITLKSNKQDKTEKQSKENKETISENVKDQIEKPKENIIEVEEIETNELMDENITVEETNENNIKDEENCEVKIDCITKEQDKEDNKKDDQTKEDEKIDENIKNIEENLNEILDDGESEEFTLVDDDYSENESKIPESEEDKYISESSPKSEKTDKKIESMQVDENETDEKKDENKVKDNDKTVGIEITEIIKSSSSNEELNIEPVIEEPQEHVIPEKNSSKDEIGESSQDSINEIGVQIKEIEVTEEPLVEDTEPLVEDAAPLVEDAESDTESMEKISKEIELQQKKKSEDFGSLIDEVQKCLRTSSAVSSPNKDDPDLEKNTEENDILLIDDESQITPVKADKRKLSEIDDSLLSSTEKAKKKVRFNETVESFNLSD